MTTGRKSLFALGMRETEPRFCWRLTDNGSKCCIRERGHDDGIHEDRARDEVWLVKSEGTDDPHDRSLAYWGPFASMDDALASGLHDIQCVIISIPASKRLVFP